MGTEYMESRLGFAPMNPGDREAILGWLMARGLSPCGMHWIPDGPWPTRAHPFRRYVTQHDGRTEIVLGSAPEPFDEFGMSQKWELVAVVEESPRDAAAALDIPDWS